MKTDNFNHAEKVLVLGAGQLGAAVLDALVPAVIERRGTVSVIVSPAAGMKPASCGRQTIRRWPTPEPPSSPSISPVAPWRRWPISFADSPP